MDDEAINLLPALRRPLHYSELEFGNAMEVMTKLFIERINGPALKEDLRLGASPDLLEKIKKFGGLKTLQTWLEQKVDALDAGDMMLPLFVLYDFRVAYKHLIPVEKQLETKGSCLRRLGLAPDSTLEEQYDALVQRLRSAFEAMRDVINERQKLGRLETI